MFLNSGLATVRWPSAGTFSVPASPNFAKQILGHYEAHIAGVNAAYIAEARAAHVRKLDQEKRDLLDRAAAERTRLGVLQSLQS
jgi:hypothetical protein